MLIQFAFFSAHFLFSIPWSRVVNTICYQKTQLLPGNRHDARMWAQLVR